MKKTITLLLIICLTAFSASAQRDTTKAKSDTAFIPAYEKLDTSAVVIIYGDLTGNVKYTDGYVVRQGFVVVKGKELQWVKEPQTVGFLNYQKQPMQKVRIFQVLPRETKK